MGSAAVARRVWQGMGALGGLLLVVVGYPLAAVWLVGWPLPRHIPPQDVWQAWLAHPSYPVIFLIDAGACVLWVLWAVLTYAILADIAARTSRIRLPQRLLPVGVRRLAAALVGSLAIAVGATAAAAAPPITHPGIVAAAPAVPPPAALASAPTTATGHLQGSPVQVTVLAGGRRYTYIVRRGDTLSHIAADWLGDPERWPEIYHLNQGRHFPAQGGALTNPNLIYPGWVLTLPADARPPASATPAPATQPPTPPGAGTPTPPGPATPTPHAPAPASPTPSPAASTPASPAPSPTSAAPSGTPSTAATRGAAPSATASFAAPPASMHAGQDTHPASAVTGRSG